MTATTRTRHFTLAALGTLLLCGAGAANAAEPNAPLTVGDWQTVVGKQLDSQLRTPRAAMRSDGPLIGTVDVSFDRDGSLVGTRVNRTSGVAAVDREMVRVAQHIAYPPLPAGIRGRAQTVTLQAVFGVANTPEQAMRHENALKALASGARAKHDSVQTAALPSG